MICDAWMIHPGLLVRLLDPSPLDLWQHRQGQSTKNGPGSAQLPYSASVFVGEGGSFVCATHAVATSEISRMVDI